MNCQATRPERDPRDRPLAGLGLQLIGRQIEPVALGVAAHYRVVGVLVEAVEAKPQTKAVRHRDAFLDRLRRVDGGRALVLDHVTGHQVAAVRGRVEDNVWRPSLDASFEHRLQ